MLTAKVQRLKYQHSWSKWIVFIRYTLLSLLWSNTKMVTPGNITAASSHFFLRFIRTTLQTYQIKSMIWFHGHLIQNHDVIPHNTQIKSTMLLIYDFTYWQAARIKVIIWFHKYSRWYGFRVMICDVFSQASQINSKFVASTGYISVVYLAESTRSDEKRSAEVEYLTMCRGVVVVVSQSLVL